MAKIAINIKDGSVEREAERETIIGIDLGTTNSLVAYIQDGDPLTITDHTGKSSLIPSIIHFNDQDEPIVGVAAKEQMILDPSRTIYSVKRLLGKSFNDLGHVTNYLGYTIIDQNEEELVKIKVGQRYYSPIELSAMILRELKSMAETHLKVGIQKAVITVPAYFNDSQRQATRDAGKLAGLDVLRIVNEPTAASLAYDIGTSRDQSETVVVYDLGGGTFDISILEIEDGVFEVLATNGDTFLGGDDFDREIINHWLNEHGLSQDNIAEDKILSQTYRMMAEKAKKHLSSEDNFTSEDEKFQLSKIQFESLIGKLVERTIQLCKSCLADSGKSISDIDQIIMVGGSTRTPFIKESVADYFQKPINDTLDPDQVVAMGAAVQADILAGNRKDMLLLDITPLSLGIETVGGLMDTIIPRNSKVPMRAGRNYTTSVDGQKNLKVAVFQGERDLVADNRKLGEFILKGIPPMPAGIPKIEIQFILDADGILRVKAIEERSGTETEVEIKSQYGISEEEMAKMLLTSIQNAQSDMELRSVIEAATEAQNVILHSKKFITQNHSILSPEEVTGLNSHITKLESAIQAKDKDAINSEMEALNEYSAPFAQRAMDHNISEALQGANITKQLPNT